MAKAKAVTKGRSAPKKKTVKQSAPKIKQFDFENAEWDWDTIQIKRVQGDSVQFNVYDKTTDRTIFRGEHLPSLDKEVQQIILAAIKADKENK
jgi:predicted metal-dependent peptidase